MLHEHRMLIASPLHYGASAHSLAHGFRERSIDICPVDLYHYQLMGSSLHIRAVNRLASVALNAEYNKAIIETAKTYKPKLFLTVKGSFLTKDTLETLRDMGMFTVMFYPDCHFGHADVYEDVFPLYDLFVTTKSYHKEELEKRLGGDRIAFVHHGFSGLAHRPVLPSLTDGQFAFDCLYAGNFSEYKAKWLQGIVARLPDINLHVVGGRWQEHAKQFGLEGRLAGHVMSGDIYSRVIQSSRINIAFHFGPAHKGGWEDFVSTRTFEIPACKGFMLHIDNEEIRSMFKVGEEIDVFQDVDDLCEKITYYLEHPDERLEMLEKGYQRVIAEHSYNHRADEILALIKERI